MRRRANERGKGGRRLLPLVQADGTKSIMYKDVKRNGSEMPNGVRMNGEGGGGRRPRRRRGTMDTQDGGKKDEELKEGKEERGSRGEAQRSPLREATRKGRRLRSTREK